LSQGGARSKKKKERQGKTRKKNFLTVANLRKAQRNVKSPKADGVKNPTQKIVRGNCLGKRGKGGGETGHIKDKTWNGEKKKIET